MITVPQPFHPDQVRAFWRTPGYSLPSVTEPPRIMNDPLSEVTMEQLIAEIQKRLVPMTNDDRQGVISDLLGGYCPACGSHSPGGCYCMCDD